MPREPFGTAVDHAVIEKLTISDGDLSADVITIGATLQSLRVPGKGGVADVCLGFDDVEPYKKRHPYFGSTAGRVAGRITGAQFTLDGQAYQIDKNEPADDPKHGLHGGFVGWDMLTWKVDDLADKSVRLSLQSANGDRGYPGAIDISVTYTLDGGALRLDYEATTSAPTPLAPTNHAYFNLAGAGNGDVLDHVLTVHAEEFAKTNEDFSFTGEKASVIGTPDDLRTPTKIAERIGQLHRKHGSMYFVEGDPGTLRPAAQLVCERGGRKMDVETDETCLQFYSGMMLDQIAGKAGQTYNQFGGLCLEAQAFPDALNHPGVEWGPLVLRPGETYRQTTLYRFGSV